MDTQYRKEQYQRIISKVNAFKGSASTGQEVHDKHLSFLQDEVNQLIESIRNRGDQSNSKIHYLLLAVPLTLILIWDSITSGFDWINLVCLLFMGMALYLTHYKMEQLHDEARAIKKDQKGPPSTARAFILTKLGYLEKAMEIKKMRLLMVSIFYMLFFPLLLVKLHGLVLGTMAFDSASMAYGISYVLAGALWFFYYNRAFEFYDGIEENVELIQSNF